MHLPQLPQNIATHKAKTPRRLAAVNAKIKSPSELAEKIKEDLLLNLKSANLLDDSSCSMTKLEYFRKAFDDVIHTLPSFASVLVLIKKEYDQYINSLFQIQQHYGKVVAQLDTIQEDCDRKYRLYQEISSKNMFEAKERLTLNSEVTKTIQLQVDQWQATAKLYLQQAENAKMKLEEIQERSHCLVKSNKRAVEEVERARKKEYVLFAEMNLIRTQLRDSESKYSEIEKRLMEEMALRSKFVEKTYADSIELQLRETKKQLQDAYEEVYSSRRDCERAIRVYNERSGIFGISNVRRLVNRPLSPRPTWVDDCTLFSPFMDDTHRTFQRAELMQVLCSHLFLRSRSLLYAYGYKSIFNSLLSEFDVYLDNWNRKRTGGEREGKNAAADIVSCFEGYLGKNGIQGVSKKKYQNFLQEKEYSDEKKGQKELGNLFSERLKRVHFGKSLNMLSIFLKGFSTVTTGASTEEVFSQDIPQTSYFYQNNPNFLSSPYSTHLLGTISSNYGDKFVPEDSGLIPAEEMTRETEQAVSQRGKEKKLAEATKPLVNGVPGMGTVPSVTPVIVSPATKGNEDEIELDLLTTESFPLELSNIDPLPPITLDTNPSILINTPPAVEEPLAINHYRKFHEMLGEQDLLYFIPETSENLYHPMLHDNYIKNLRFTRHRVYNILLFVLRSRCQMHHENLPFIQSLFLYFHQINLQQHLVHQKTQQQDQNHLVIQYINSFIYAAEKYHSEPNSILVSLLLDGVIPDWVAVENLQLGQSVLTALRHMNHDNQEGGAELLMSKKELFQSLQTLYNDKTVSEWKFLEEVLPGGSQRLKFDVSVLFDDDILLPSPLLFTLRLQHIKERCRELYSFEQRLREIVQKRGINILRLPTTPPNNFFGHSYDNQRFDVESMLGSPSSPTSGKASAGDKKKNQPVEVPYSDQIEKLKGKKPTLETVELSSIDFAETLGALTSIKSTSVKTDVILATGFQQTIDSLAEDVSVSIEVFTSNIRHLKLFPAISSLSSLTRKIAPNTSSPQDSVNNSTAASLKKTLNQSDN